MEIKSYDLTPPSPEEEGDNSLSYKGRVRPEDSPRGDREGSVKNYRLLLSLRSGQVAPMVSGSCNDS